MRILQLVGQAADLLAPQLGQMVRLPVVRIQLQATHSIPIMALNFTSSKDPGTPKVSRQETWSVGGRMMHKEAQ